jgi:hypothetical protein
MKMQGRYTIRWRAASSEEVDFSGTEIKGFSCR